MSYYVENFHDAPSDVFKDLRSNYTFNSKSAHKSRNFANACKFAFKTLRVLCAAHINSTFR